MKLEKEALLNHWLKEIKTLEYQINHENEVNKQLKLKKALHLTLLNIKKIIPIIISITISTTTSSILFNSLIEEQKKYLHTTKIINNLGYINVEKNYQTITNKSDYIEEYGKWILLPNQEYQRIIKTYYLNMNNFTNEQILKIIRKESNILEKLINQNTRTRIETSKSLSQEQINEPPRITAHIYQKDLDNFIAYQVTDKDIQNYVTLIAIFTLILVTFLLSFRDSCTNFDYIKEKNEINRKYSKLDINKIKEKIKIKKDNYNYIRGNNNEWLLRNKPNN